jgi:hypothetical protein
VVDVVVVVVVVVEVVVVVVVVDVVTPSIICSQDTPKLSFLLFSKNFF